MKIFLVFLFALVGISLASGQIIPTSGHGSLAVEGEGQVFWTDAVVHPEGFYTLTGIVMSEGRRYLALARFLADGAPDCSFQNEGIAEFSIPIDWEYMAKIARTKEGKLLVLFNPAKADSALYLARFSEDGFRDPSFGENGILRVPLPHPARFLDMILQEDGGILAAGFQVIFEEDMHTCMVLRLFPDGRVDRSFYYPSPCPASYSFHLMAMAPLPEGKTLLAMHVENELVVARIMPKGAMDESFGEEGRIKYPIEGFRPYDIIVLPDASWIIAGGGYPAPAGCPIAIKCLPDGRPDPAFGDDGIVCISDAQEIAASALLLPNGKWMTAGMTRGDDQIGYFAVRRFLANGTPDPAFGNNGLSIPRFEKDYYQGSAMFLKLLRNGEILAGGTINFKGALTRLDKRGNGLSAFGKEGMVVSVWGGRNPVDMDCYKVLSRGDGSLVAAGAARKPFDSEMLYIRLESSGALDSNFARHSFNLSNPITGIDAVLQADGKLVVGGRRRTQRGLDFIACRLNPDGSLDTSFASNGFIALDKSPFDFLGAIALQKDGKILLAGDTQNEDTYDRELAVYRLLPNGQLDVSFGKNGLHLLQHFPSGQFAGMTLQDDGKILLLDSCPPFGFDLIRLSPDGAFDPSFGDKGLVHGLFPSGPAFIQSLQSATSPGGHILIAGQLGPKAGLFRYLENGAPDLSFGKNGFIMLPLPETFRKIAVLPDGKILLAGSGQADAAPHHFFFVARFLADGIPDPSFGENGVAIAPLPGLSELSSLLALEDGAVILGGKGLADNSDNHMGIVLVRLLSELNAGHICPKHIFPFLNVYPYPIQTHELVLKYDIPATANVMVSLLHPDGSELALLLDLCRPEGFHEEILQLPPGLPQGNYLLQTRTEEAEARIRVFYRPLVD
jgi:uncharacterized delta-60 repeat protein